MGRSCKGLVPHKRAGRISSAGPQTGELTYASERKMASTVYFARVNAGSKDENAIARIRQLFEAAQFDTLIEADTLTAIKLHVGERGNDSHLRPEHFQDVRIDKKHFYTVKIAGDIVAAPSMIVMSHFKGHGMAGFGGAIKNLAMGCAPRAGKADQHKGMNPIVDVDKCSACGVCIGVCPRSAISIEAGASSINYDLCVGCGECMAMCLNSSISYDWEHDLQRFLEMLTEYAFGATVSKRGVGYFNLLLQITPDCDCVPWSDTPIVPDVGILASTDPVAIDAASVDLVNGQRGIPGTRLVTNLEPGDDKFKGVWSETQGSIQITYGERIGL